MDSGALSAIESAESSNDHILAPEDRKTVKKLITEVEAKVDNLDEEIAQLHAIRRGEIARLHSLHIAISPQKQLPVEILCDIFRFHEPEKDYIDFPNDLQPHLSPWNLRHICSSWRQAALSCHTLWNALAVEWEDTIQPSNQSDTECKFSHKRWTQRLDNARQILPTSGKLRITLNVRTNTPPRHNLVRSAYRTLIVPFLERVEILSYQWPESCIPCLSSLHNTSFRQMTSLNHLALNFTLTEGPGNRPSFGWIDDSSDLSLGDLGNLRHLALSGNDKILEFLTKQSFPWESLTTLTLLVGEPEDGQEINSTTNVMSALRMCRNLESLEIEIDFPHDQFFEPVSFPRLKMFDFGSMDADRLTLFVTPLLTSLTVAGYKMGGWPQKYFLQQSQCSLQEFKESTFLQTIAPPNFRMDFIEFADLLKNVKTFQTIMILHQANVRLIGSGQCFPKVEKLRFPTRSASDALSALEPRFSQSSAGSRIKALTLEVRKSDLRGRDIDRLEARIKDIRMWTGTNIDVQILSAPEWMLRRESEDQP